VLDEATARLRNPPSIVGAWVDPGHDLGEIDPSAEIAGHAVMMGSGDGVVILGKAKPMRGPLPRPWRVCWAKAPGADTAGPVMQVSERSWFPAGGEDIGAFADACIAAKRWKDLAAAEDSIAHAAARLRVRGTRLLAQGDAKGAREALEAAIAEKRVPTDTYWYLAEALRQCRRGKDAKPHLEKYLAKAGKKGAFVAEATKRLAGK
jgi:hypothetical protein